MRRRLDVILMAGAALALVFPSILAGEDPTDPGQYIVKTSDLTALEESASTAGMEISPLITYPNPSSRTLADFGDCYVVNIPEELAAASNFAGILRSLPGIIFVEPNARIYLDESWDEPADWTAFGSPMSPYTPNDPRYDDQWDKPIAEINKAWDKSKGDGVTVAILDTGVDTTHEDLVENLVGGYNFALNNEDISDIAGHGTMVCGMACARMNNAKGVAGTSGRSSLMMLRIADNSGAMYTNWAVNAINYALDHGVKIISMSWGAYSDLGLGFTVNSAWQRGAFMCGGAANDDRDQKFYPAAYEKVMAVGATNQADTRWPSSNYGSWVDIFAPGGVSTSRGGGYSGAQATSFTTPQIAALAALVWSAYPAATNQDVWDNVIEGADTIDSDVGEILRMNANNAVSKEITAVAEEPAAKPRISAPEIARGTIRFQTGLPSGTAYIFSIFDVGGRRVWERTGSISSREFAIDPGLEQGVYFWQFASSGSVQTGKLVYLR